MAIHRAFNTNNYCLYWQINDQIFTVFIPTGYIRSIPKYDTRMIYQNQTTISRTKRSIRKNFNNSLRSNIVLGFTPYAIFYAIFIS